jgi:thiol-disulfide isomerase/thioredoxin
MKDYICFLFLLFTVAFSGGSSVAQTSKQGAPANLLESARGTVAVLIFVRTDCPICNRYAPNIQRIRAHAAADTNFFLIFPDKSESSASIQKYVSVFGYKFPAIRDPDHFLVKRAHAKFTPEAAVFDRNGNLIYHGRIDNLYEAFGRARPAPTTHELEDAIQAAWGGRALPRNEVVGVGCYISDLE